MQLAGAEVFHPILGGLHGVSFDLAITGPIADQGLDLAGAGHAAAAAEAACSLWGHGHEGHEEPSGARAFVFGIDTRGATVIEEIAGEGIVCCADDSDWERGGAGRGTVAPDAAGDIVKTFDVCQRPAAGAVLTEDCSVVVAGRVCQTLDSETIGGVAEDADGWV